MYKISIELLIPQEEMRKRVIDLLEIENNQNDSDRSTVKVISKSGSLIINIISTDLVSLRAFSNSTLRLLRTTIRLDSLVDDLKR